MYACPARLFVFDAHILISTSGQDRRGLVVTVYYDPDETSEEDLQQYERGEQGIILV